MLKKSRQLILRQMQAMGQSAAAFKRAPWTMMMTVVVIAITLVLPLLFWVLMEQLKPVVNEWQQGKEIALYLDASFESADEAALMQRIVETNGVASALFVSADDSLAELEKQEGMKDIRKYLPENPLPAMIEVMPAATISTPEQVEVLFRVLQQYPHVEQAKLNRDWVGRLHGLLDFMVHLTWVLGALFGLMVVFIIRNLLRLAAEEHHDEIQLLKLIGATDAFILRPFLYTGACLGMLGVLGAFLGGYVILLSLGHALRAWVAPEFGISFSVGFSAHQVVLCVLLGLLLGWIGAYLPLKRQLSHIEPCH
ncbi:MAG: permease-like cell division protein FtsX [Legionellaceae bacterium]|nr:permease-like cell division protein FtsX [Legionellaceae bacterium]